MFLCENEDEMNEKERELVNEEFVNTENTYNMGLGGEGGPQFRGKKHSEETKRKIAESLKNQSEEARKKISERLREAHKAGKFSHKGHPNPNKGKKRGPMSEEQKKKISESMAGLKRNGVKRSPPSEETKEKIRQSVKLRMMDEEIRAKIRESRSKQIMTDEIKKKISEKLKGNVPWNKGLKFKAE